jgi:hypothetical protein
MTVSHKKMNVVMMRFSHTTPPPPRFCGGGKRFRGIPSVPAARLYALSGSAGFKIFEYLTSTIGRSGSTSLSPRETSTF